MCGVAFRHDRSLQTEVLALLHLSPQAGRNYMLLMSYQIQKRKETTFKIAVMKRILIPIGPVGRLDRGPSRPRSMNRRAWIDTRTKRYGAACRRHGCDPLRSPDGQHRPHEPRRGVWMDAHTISVDTGVTMPGSNASRQVSRISTATF